MAEPMFNTVYQAICVLVDYACDKSLIGEEDRAYAANLLLDALHLDADESFDPLARACAPNEVPPLENILSALLDDAVARGVIDGGIASRDLLDTRLMGCVTPRPSEVTRTFWQLHAEDPQKATDWFYQLALSSDYIRTYRIERDRKWKSVTPYGELDITINLSKPEKDPKAIAAAGKAKASGYPKCLLCREAEGYAGR